MQHWFIGLWWIKQTARAIQFLNTVLEHPEKHSEKMLDEIRNGIYYLEMADVYVRQLAKLFVGAREEAVFKDIHDRVNDLMREHYEHRKARKDDGRSTRTATK